MIRQIFAAEVNFEDSPLHVREKFNDSEKNIKLLLSALRPRVDEVYILATRYRFTVYVVHESLAPLTEFFHAENSLKGYVQFYYNSGESVTHLMASASGLLSSVKGEGRVLSDIIKCYQWAAASGCLGITLDNALTKAIETGKAVRTQTGIDKFCASVVETGLELLYDRMENLHKKNFLIVGTGKMARLALEYLSREGMHHIIIMGHDQAKAQRLAKKFSITAAPLESFAEYFFPADVIVGVSDAELDGDLLRGDRDTGEERKTRFILDLGIPPNFDPQQVEMHASEFYNLDDIRRIQPSPLEAFGGLEVAWRMVMRTANEFVHLLQLLNHSPVLTAYLTRQFTLKNGVLKVKPKRSFRSMLSFKKTNQVLGVSGAGAALNVKAHVNNHLAENGREAVKSLQDLKKFKFYFSDN